MNYGTSEGEVCNRLGCAGVINAKPVEGCSCHIRPPCNACTAPCNYCPICDWAEADDVSINDNIVNLNKSTGNYRCWTPRPLDTSKIDYYSKSHTNSSMIKEGVYPEGTTSAAIENLVRGTFGGRFESFGGGKFKYIAYTD